MSFQIGIDVGGTNTDAVLLKGSQVVAIAKVPTLHSDLFSSTKAALDQIMKHLSGAFPQGEAPIRLNLSTTLSTNAIVEGKGALTKVVAIPGPGVNLTTLGLPFPIIELSGYMDHRGREVSALVAEELELLQGTLGRDCEAVAIGGKFSQRNPQQESAVGKHMESWFPGLISYGHRLSGRANFPRRLVTAYLNSTVGQTHLDFLTMWEKLLAELELHVGEIGILKADGGTMTLEDSKERPIETILSGPAASIMGVRALSETPADQYVIVDIGGTTTDLAVVVQGEVLFERDGATISSYKTLVPAVLTRSLGLGGDSTLSYRDGEGLQIGPRRAGLPVACGGDALTPTDAAVALGLVELGSKELAQEGFQRWGNELGRDWKELAKDVIDGFVGQIVKGIFVLYDELDSEPLYTVAEVLNPPQLSPMLVVGLGAPAHVFIPKVAEKLALPHEVLPYSAGANAIGAAAAQPTLGITLQADTELATVTIPEMGYQDEIKRPLFFDLTKARELAAYKLKEYALSKGYPEEVDVFIVEEESFQMVRDFRTVGQIHSVRAQIVPQVQRVKGGEGDGRW